MSVIRPPKQNDFFKLMYLPTKWLVIITLRSSSNYKKIKNNVIKIEIKHEAAPLMMVKKRIILIFK